jgi:methylphosphotriester-DNA--protein-cysteine methyltransferase
MYAEQYLMKIFSSKLQVNPYVDYAVNRIINEPHQTTIHQLTLKVGYSQKHLIKIFKEHVGLTPKGFLKVMRFQKAISEIEKEQSCKMDKHCL